MKNYNVHFVTYANHLFEKQSARICKEAKISNFFSSINPYKPSCLDFKFYNHFSEILESKRGGGYWIWKPYIIQKALQSVKMNDFLVYLDAGCSINPQGEKRFTEYLDMLDGSKYSALSFKFLDSWRPEKHWTFNETFRYFNVSSNSEIIDTGQIIGGVLVFQKTDHSLFLINEWMRALYEMPELFTDRFQDSILNKNQGLIENRHDQSIFSVIRKIHGSVILSDETKFLNESTNILLNPDICSFYPFWATKLS
jgi:hypothetical protein